MVSTFLSSLPTFYMCTLKIPLTIVKQIEQDMRHCLWCSSDINNNKPPLTAWDMVTLPKNEAGFGIKKMAVQNDALLMKNLHKFFNHAEVPWVQLVWDKYYHTILLGQRKRGSFWWRNIIILLDQYKGISITHPENGKSIIL